MRYIKEVWCRSMTGIGHMRRLLDEMCRLKLEAPADAAGVSDATWNKRGALSVSESNVDRTYWTVYDFWTRWGDELVREFGVVDDSHDAFFRGKHELVVQMRALHTDIAAVVDMLVAKEAPEDSVLDRVETKIGALLRLQRMHQTQVGRVDAFQKYLSALRVLLSVLISRRF